jgi:DNA invertase Pin-like site-specific DNA recombinase
MKLAYSYVRFSSAEQAKGDSLRRQTAKAAAWCLENGYTLDPSTYKDLGVSGFRGKNAASGALAQFLEEECRERSLGSVP